MNAVEASDTQGIPLLLSLRHCDDVALVGGKAANLGELIRAGFDVPDGFVVTTAAFRAARQHDLIPDSLAASIIAHYHVLGGGAVAVRSSATAEDMAGASMAGQYDTFLDVRTEADLLDRVRQCWASLDSPRTRAYLAEQKIAIDRVAMAVVVQKLAMADVAGVLFSVNPRGVDDSQMLIEASWGLGESVVSGEVQPDTLTLARADGRVIDAIIAEKHTQIDPSTGQEVAVLDAKRNSSCLSSTDVHQLWQIAHRAERHFGRPQDIEWAIVAGHLHVLQSRAITTLDALRAKQSTIEAVRAQVNALLAKGHGPWVPHNIGETLTHPTPLTWSVIRRFLSGKGGFGAMYRRVGFEPGPRVADDGFVHRIGGRVLMDLSTAPEMFFADFPYAYDPELLRGNPEAGQSPPTVPRGSAMQRFSVGKKLAAVQAKIATLADSLDHDLELNTIPAFTGWVAQQRTLDLTSLSNTDLRSLWVDRQTRVMDGFAPESLLPSLIVGQVQADLTALLADHIYDQDIATLTRSLISVGPADKTILANQALYDVGSGKLTLDDWLDTFGHRAPDELDLASLRWRERRDDVARVASQLANGADPSIRFEQHKKHVDAELNQVRARLPSSATGRFDQLIGRMKRYAPYRENGKFYLMLGYALLRDAALEAGRRLDIGDGVFYLDEAEMLDSLTTGFAPIELINQRRQRYAAEAKLQLPDLIDGAAVATLGAAAPAAIHSDADGWKGFSISSGIGRGPVCVVDDPASAPTPASGYILVCRTTDPSWTPSFVNAAGVVLETGGSLSHGAIVAREMGVPAVVVPGAKSLLAGAGVVVVDGDRGFVSRAICSSKQTDSCASDSPLSLLPAPGPGARDRRAAAWRNRLTIFWLGVLGAMFLVPSFNDRVMGFFDLTLWPLVRAVGPVWGTAVIAAGVAAITMILQSLLTDSARLRLAKQRKGADVQRRLIGSAMVPIGVLLGPLIAVFLWLPARVDPVLQPPPPGARIILKALVQGDVTQPITLVASPMPIIVGDPTQHIPEIRSALEALRGEWITSTDSAQPLPWQIVAAGDAARQSMTDSLDRYLASPIPPQTLAWTLKAPAEPGVYVLKLNSADQTIPIRVAVGQRSVPQPTLFQGEPARIQSVEVVYPPKLPKDLQFFQPLKWVGSTWNFGWLSVYLLAYIPMMFLLKRLLRLP